MKTNWHLVTLLFIGFSCLEVNLKAMEAGSEEILLQKLQDYVEIQKLENPEEFEVFYNRLYQESSYVGALNNFAFHKFLTLIDHDQFSAFLKHKKYSIDIKDCTLKLSIQDNTHILHELDNLFTFQEAQNLKKYLKTTDKKDLILLIKLIIRRFEVKKVMKDYAIGKVQEMINNTTKSLQKLQDWLDNYTLDHYFRYTHFRDYLNKNFSLNIILQINQLIYYFMDNQEAFDNKQQFSAINLIDIFPEFYKLLCDVSSKANNLKNKTEKKQALPYLNFHELIHCSFSSKN